MNGDEICWVVSMMSQEDTGLGGASGVLETW